MWLLADAVGGPGSSSFLSLLINNNGIKIFNKHHSLVFKLVYSAKIKVCAIHSTPNFLNSFSCHHFSHPSQQCLSTSFSSFNTVITSSLDIYLIKVQLTNQFHYYFPLKFYRFPVSLRHVAH